MAPENDGADTPEERVAAAQAVAAQTLARYRELVASAPGLVAGMVGGNTIEEIDASAEAARQAYSEISREVARGYERNIQAANPARSAHDPGVETLKPESKIALGLRTARKA